MKHQQSTHRIHTHLQSSPTYDPQTPAFKNRSNKDFKDLLAEGDYIHRVQLWRTLTSKFTVFTLESAELKQREPNAGGSYSLLTVLHHPPTYI